MLESGLDEGGYTVMGWFSGLSRGPGGDAVKENDVEEPLRNTSGYWGAGPPIREFKGRGPSCRGLKLVCVPSR